MYIMLKVWKVFYVPFIGSPILNHAKVSHPEEEHYRITPSLCGANRIRGMFVS